MTEQKNPETVPVPAESPIEVSPRVQRLRTMMKQTIREAPGLLRQYVHTMERGRSWSQESEGKGKENVRTILGPYAEIIERSLENGQTVMEIGAGKLETSKELAGLFPQGSLVAVEPFVQPEALQNLPLNLDVIPKKLEEVAKEDLKGKKIHCCFAAWVFDYAIDKLTFLKNTYDLLEDEGVAIIQCSTGSVSDPPLKQIFQDMGNESIYREERTSEGSRVIILTKREGQKLDLSTYSLVSTPHNGGGMIESHYQRTL